MAKFTTRVELHGADEWDDYEELHKEMRKEGFSRTITDENGVKRHLPNAEYNIEGAFTKYQVLEKAKRAAGRTDHKFSILVTQSNGRTWHGLKLV